MANWKHDSFIRTGLRAFLGLFVVAGAMLGAGCEEAAPPEQRVRAFVAQAELWVENREFVELVDHIAGDYLDSRGNDKLKAAAILRAFYLRYKSVHLHVRIADIQLRSADRAAVTLYVAIAKRPFPDVMSGTLPDADFFRLDLDLAASGDSYEVLQAEWRRASAADALF